MKTVRAPIPLHTKILLGLVLGALSGGGLYLLGVDTGLLQWLRTEITEPIGTLFLRLLILLVVPLVFSSLVAGVAGTGDLRKLGRIGAKSFGLTLVVSALSVVIGLGIANVVRPGERIDPELKVKLQTEFRSQGKDTIRMATEGPKKGDSALMTAVKTITPTNIVAAISREPPDMLGLMFFALLLGIAATMVGTSGLPFVATMDSLYAITAQCIDIVMRTAPVAVFCLVFSMTSRFGFGLLVGLGWYVLAVIGGLLVHCIVVYGAALIVLARVNPLAFFYRIRTVLVTAFSTASSNATLPTALRVAEVEVGIPSNINSFVLTVGATANQNGTALYEGVTVLFLAQLAGVELSMTMQLMVLYLAILGGIGTAGVPAGSIPFVIVVLTVVGVDPALIAVILGVDRLLDMCRTTVNVAGDIVVAAYVARSEGASLMPTAPDRAEAGQ